MKLSYFVFLYLACFSFTQILCKTEIPLKTYDLYSSFYYAEIGVGTPAQQFHVMIDTGMSNFWIVSKEDSKLPTNWTNATFNPQQSSTFKNVLLSNGSVKGFVLPFYYDTIIGTVFSDSVTFGGMKANNVNLVQLTDATPRQIAGQLYGQGACEGALGLGFAQLAFDNLTPLYYSFQNSSQMDTFSFGLDLNYQGGMMTIGGYPDAYPQDNCIQFNVLQSQVCSGTPGQSDYSCLSGFWDVNVSSISTIKKIGNQMYDTQLIAQTTQQEQYLGVIDAANNVIVLPTQTYNQFMEQIPSGLIEIIQNQPVFDCSAIDQFPDLAIELSSNTTGSIKSNTFILSPQNYSIVAGSIYPYLAYLGSQKCTLQIIGGDWASNLQFVGLGVPFYREFYIHFDYDNKVVGIAAKNSNTSNEINKFQKPSKIKKFLNKLLNKYF